VKFGFRVLLILLGCGIYSLCYAGCPCYSELLGNLHNLGDNFLWGLELTNIYYFVKTNKTDHYFFPKANTVFNYILPYNLSLFLNLTFRYRPANTVSCPLNVAQPGLRWGVSQGFMELETGTRKLKLGRFRYKTGLGFLFDIRVDGLTITQSLENQNIELFLGAVSPDIGRNRFFCEREIILEERICTRQLCKVGYGKNGFGALSYHR
jgi:hypothetical protein